MPPEPLELSEKLDSLLTQENQLLVHLVHQVPQVYLAPLALPVQQVHQVSMVDLDQLVRLAHLDHLDPQAPLDLLELMDKDKVLQALPVLLVLQVKMDFPELLERTDLTAPPDQVVLPEPQEDLEVLDLRVILELQDYQAHPDPLDPLVQLVE